MVDKHCQVQIGESRHLYDHLGVLSPILLALTAATPILKCRLADTDVRWATISAAVTPQELEIESPPKDPMVQEKYSLVKYVEIPSTYICNHKHGEGPSSSTNKYNDVDVPYDET